MFYKKDFEEWAEQYLSGNLSKKEQLDFEKALEQDKELESAFVEHKAMFLDLNKLGRRWRLRKKLQQTEENIIRSEEKSHKRNWFKLSAAAASIILISVLTTLFTAGYLTQKKQANKFNALKRDVERMKYNQNVLVSDYNSKVKSVTANFGGSGFLISDEGYLVTNYHVVASSDSLFVTDKDGKDVRAEMVLASRSYDLAILKITDKNYLENVKIPYIVPASSNTRLGDKIFTLGYPKEDIVYGEGYLSSRSGFMGDTTSFQISMALNPGNSGGPLFNEYGQIVGVISGKQNEKEGVAFAIKSNFIQKMVEMTERTLEVKIQTPVMSSKSKHKSKSEMIQQFESCVFQVRVYDSN
jgi:S1-C subfamily serine protease